MAHTTIETLKTMLAHLDDAKKYQSLRDVLQSLPAPDLAPVFEDLSPEKRPVLFRLCPKDQAAALFAELTPETQQSLIEELSDKELGAVVAALCADDAADLVEEMPAGVVRRILAQADAGTRRTINELLKYPQDSAGGVMTPEFMELRPGWTVRRAMAELRAHGFDKETINTCYVTGPDRTLLGEVTLRALVLEKDPGRPVQALMQEAPVRAATAADREEVSRLFEKYGLLAIPVVDAEDRLVGIVTVDDAMTILQDEAAEDLAKMNAMAPSDKPYFRMSLWELYRSRAPWLLFLMLSATFSSLVIRGYEDALAAVTALTAYIPMLTDTGGNAGSQSSTLVIRGMAVGEIRLRDFARVFWKELRVSMLVGAALSTVNYVRLILTYPGQTATALTVAAALFVTVLLAKTVGGVLPMAAKFFKADPAIMAAPLITTIVDAISLVVYFNIASALLPLA